MKCQYYVTDSSRYIQRLDYFLDTYSLKALDTYSVRFVEAYFRKFNGAYSVKLL